ncbi:unnamed protein product [Adineta steineri]|uniref:Rhodanese domain-containing protein n=1 Tax=Adineta steineri TaxID=433720 RepID=A0A815N8M7_9BILA|nr:unnamed protein product [Adineta steineri]CAF4075520.1 unnamed protein product [Adineta steineri]
MDCIKQEKNIPMFIKPEDLHLYENVKFVDVRDGDAYNSGHINNSVNFNDLFTYLLPSSSKDDVNEMKKYFEKRFGELGISGKEHVIIYEQSMDNQYGASCRGFFIFKYMKHPNVSTLEGGLDGFLRVENGAKQLTTVKPTIVECQYKGHDDDDEFDWQMTDYIEVLEIVKNKPEKTWLLDVRDAVEWKGESSSPYGIDFVPRKGRIPNSKWIEWYDFHELDSNKNVIKYKSNEQIQKLMEKNNIEKDDKITVYCFKGSRAAVVLMKLKQAGYNNIKNYFASWNEWACDFNLPIDETKINEEN